MIVRAPLPLSVKLEAFWHLTANVSYLLLFASILLLGPVLSMPARAPGWLVAGVLLVVLTAGFAGVIVFFTVARRALGEPWREGFARVPGALLLGLGHSLNTAHAVVEAFLPRVGAFERTPKFGVRRRGEDLHDRSYLRRARSRGAGEVAMVCYALGLAVLAIQCERWEALPFLILVAVAFGLVAWLSIAPTGQPSLRRAQARGLSPDAAGATPI